MSNYDIRPVPGFEGLYSVTGDGRVLSHAKRVGFGRGAMQQERWLKQSINSGGYPSVRPFKNGIGMAKAVHIMVCSAFHGPRPFDGAQVNHIDGIKTNNRADNLEWVSRSGNMIHAIKRGLFSPPSGAINGRSKLSERDVRIILERYASGERVSSIARSFCINHSTASAICARTTWKHVAA